MRTNNALKLTVSAIISLSFVFPVSLASADQGFYVTDTSAKPGMLMSLSSNPEVAELATPERASSLVGILGEGVTSFDVQEDQVNIITDGVSSTLVSTIGGDIRVGDRITASSLAGIGSKLTGNGWVVGIAQASFDSSSTGAVKSSVTDVSGVKHDVYVGKIPVLVNVTNYNDTQTPEESDSSIIPNSLQKAVDSIAGKRASQIAVILAFLMLASGFFVAALIANAAIRNAIISTGRQPLAKQAILRRMVQACLLALGLLFVSVVGALILIRIL